jgi:uncharacterized protein YjaG (DUF416 family)
MILCFDEASLILELEQLHPEHRAVFAATVAERLFPAYLSFSRRTGRGNPPVLKALLEGLWLGIEAKRVGARDEGEKIALAIGLAPREEEQPWTP